MVCEAVNSASRTEELLYAVSLVRANRARIPGVSEHVLGARIVTPSDAR